MNKLQKGSMRDSNRELTQKAAKYDSSDAVCDWLKFFHLAAFACLISQSITTSILIESLQEII